jgi:hypothetical protein
MFFISKRLFSKRSIPSIVGVCNPLVDFTLEVDDFEFLNKYQLKPGNAILAEAPIHKQLLADIWKLQ